LFEGSTQPLDWKAKVSVARVSLSQRLAYQRIEHILDSYQLWGEETVAFQEKLQVWLEQFPGPLVELALVETLIECWLRVPLPRGLAFLAVVECHLARWQQQPIVSSITPQEFEQISGLDPRPIFGSLASGSADAEPGDLG
jgi:hypothetical protein